MPLTPKDWLAIAAAFVTVMSTIAAIQAQRVKSSVSRELAGIRETLAALSQSVADSRSVNTERFARGEAIFDELRRQNTEMAKEVGEWGGFTKQLHNLMTLEVEGLGEIRKSVEDRIGDLGRHLLGDLEKLKNERIVPLEVNVRDVRENGCAFMKHRGAGNGDPKPAGCD